jgi:hypothetical protein
MDLRRLILHEWRYVADTGIHESDFCGTAIAGTEGS